VVSRLVYQKGLDLTEAVSEYIVKSRRPDRDHRPWRAGRRTGHARAGAALPGQIGVRIGFNETDARRMFAGSDFLLMPSRYEPCGLSQMYAQRFGSLPVARNTGGLADTIENGVTGFLFDESTVESYREALSRAFKVFAFPDLLNAMRCRAMAPVQLVPGGRTLRRTLRTTGGQGAGEIAQTIKSFEMPLRTLKPGPTAQSCWTPNTRNLRCGRRMRFTSVSNWKTDNPCRCCRRTTAGS
jgi:starch synthase